MARNRKWFFYQAPARPELAASEVNYWKNTLSKILKIGLEFEFNLPEKKNGSCKGDSQTCPCMLLTTNNTCWQECVNVEKCIAGNRIDICMNKTPTCEEEDCKTCSHFKMECSGIFCPNFIGACYVCNNFQVDCSSCKFKFDPKKNPDSIRQVLNDELKPVRSYGQVGPTGVHSIVQDGSLLGQKGAEIITVGRRVDYWEFFKMTQNILGKALSLGAYTNERCSIHMHGLASYYGKVVPDQEDSGIPSRVSEMERDMPEIILANLHQLVRHYQNAMTWMTMGLDKKEQLTRWEKFRVSVLPVSAAIHHMSEVQGKVSSLAGGNKYGWINYNQVGFSPDGNVKRFHVEFRGADGIMTPSAVAAIACMYYALIIKAVEISRYGVVEIGDDAWLRQAEEVKAALLNNMKGYQDGDRFSDTRELHKYYEILREESLDLVRQLKSILIGVGPAFEVLEKLAEKPVALRRVEEKTWEQIEEELKVIVNEEDKMSIAITEIITLNQITDCSDINEWIQAVGNALRQDPELSIDVDNAEVEAGVSSFVNRNREDGKLIWSSKLGSPIMI